MIEGGAPKSSPICGGLDFNRLYCLTPDEIRMAKMCRPTDPEALRAQAQELESAGLTDRDIAEAWRLPLEQIRNLLAEVR
ncbi:MAG: hypothetical protein JJT85_04635 [Chromatiales bacterium]|nr:hypothetical protein [Chromatiales bacterium]